MQTNGCISPRALAVVYFSLHATPRCLAKRHVNDRISRVARSTFNKNPASAAISLLLEQLQPDDPWMTAYKAVGVAIVNRFPFIYAESWHVAGISLK